jgi:hypothetical protein
MQQSLFSNDSQLLASKGRFPQKPPKRFAYWKSLMACVGIGLATANCPSAVAERPSAPKLFPEKTLVYFRIDDTREMQEKLAQTSLGRIGDDPQLKPILSDFYNSLVEETIESLQEYLGVDLNELLSIPNGEFAFALIPSTRNPIPCVMLEAGDEMPAVEILLARMEESFDNRYSTQAVEEIGGLEVVEWTNANRQDRQLGYFIDDGVLVMAASIESIETLAEIWTDNGSDFKPLASKREFTTIMSQCVGTEGERPQISFYADPIAIAREVTKGNGGATFVMGLLPGLGITGIKGVGGSVIFAPEDFDSLAHFHLLLESPRRGILKAIRPETGATQPEKWIPENVASYMTANWNLSQTLDGVGEIYDTFRGEDAFETQVLERAGTEIGIDFQRDFLDNLDNRFSMSQTFVKPYKINSGSNLYGIHVTNGSKFKTDILPKLYEKLSDRNENWETRTRGSHVIYQMTINSGSEAMRSPEICMTVLGDSLVFADSGVAIDEACDAFEGINGSLRQSLDYVIISNEIKDQLGEEETSIVSFQRPEESLRLFYELANDKSNINRLKEFSENNPIFKSLVGALERNELPSFDVIAKYLAPTGAFVSEDDTGIHLTSFSIRRVD